MTVPKGFDRRLDRLIEKIKDWTQPVDYLATPEWFVIRETVTQAVKPFPNAEQAWFEALVRIEHCSHDWKSIENIIYRALDPYMPARVAIAATLVAIEKESDGSPKLPV